MFSQLLRNIISRITVALITGFLFAVLLEVIFSIQYRNYSIFGNMNVLTGAIVITYLFLELAFWLNRFLDKNIPWGGGPVRRALIQTGIQIILAIMLVTGLRIVFLLLVEPSAIILLSDEITIIVFTVFLVVLLNILDFGAMLLNQWRISLAEAEKYRKESAEFEYEMLRAQVNPHFLFNSLNTLSSLVYEDQEKATEFIRKLSDVYRYVLENRRKDLTTLEEEVEFTNAYIYLIKLRFGDKLKVNVDIGEHLVSKQIAPLTLQLLLENAVKHNVVSEKKPLEIRITTTNGYLEVQNDLQKKQQQGTTTGMGLQNITSRYGMLSDKEVVISEDEKTFKVKIPLI